MTEDERDLQAVVAYLHFRSYRKAAQAIYSSKSTVQRRVTSFVHGHSHVLPCDSAGRYAVPNSIPAVSAGPSIS